ncbi:MAG: HlyD family efflux transporter periplasmic adaptor subunit [Planctomycetaceae bacterium]
MRRLAYELTRVLIPLAVLAAGAFGFAKYGQKPEVTTQIPEPVTPTVQTLKIGPSTGEFVIDVDGVSVPFRQVTLSAEIDGQIVFKAPEARAGSFVEAGTPLIEIDSTNYQLEVNRLAAMVAQADATLKSIDVQISNATTMAQLAYEDEKLQRKDLERTQSLAAGGAATDVSIDVSRGKELAARRSVQSLRNELALLAEQKKTQQVARQLSVAQMDRAIADLGRTKVSAPLTGTVVVDSVEQNDYVRKGDPLLRISDSTKIEVKTSLTVDELYWLWMNAGLLSPETTLSDQRRLEIPQTPVEVVFGFRGVDYVWKGEMSRYEGSGVDAQTRTVPCRVLVESPGDVEARSTTGGLAVNVPALYTGMFLEVRIPIRSPVPLVELPTAALRPGKEVWVVRDGRLTVTKVDVVRTEEGRVFVRADANTVSSGDEVVVSPLSNVQSGMAVHVMPASVGGGT